MFEEKCVEEKGQVGYEQMSKHGLKISGNNARRTGKGTGNSTSVTLAVPGKTNINNIKIGRVDKSIPADTSTNLNFARAEEKRAKADVKKAHKALNTVKVANPEWVKASKKLRIIDNSRNAQETQKTVALQVLNDVEHSDPNIVKAGNDLYQSKNRLIRAKNNITQIKIVAQVKKINKNLDKAVSFVFKLESKLPQLTDNFIKASREMETTGNRADYEEAFKDYKQLRMSIKNKWHEIDSLHAKVKRKLRYSSKLQ